MKKLLLIIIIGTILASNVFGDNIASEGFESNGFCGGYGWSDCWLIQQSTGIISWGDTPYDTNEVLMRGNTAAMERDINISGYSEVELSFARKVTSFENNWQGIPDKVLLYISIDNGPDIFYDEWTPDHSNNQWITETYKLTGIQGTKATIKFFSEMSDEGDEFHLDNILFDGIVGPIQNVELFVNSVYSVGREINVEFVSSESDILHRVIITKSDGTIFCDKNLMSPLVPQTSFSIICEEVLEESIDTKVFFYVSNNININSTKYFNIVNLDNNPEMLKIQQVYFSPQVLQGSSTEIFALLDTSLEINKIELELTFPDEQQRYISMFKTSNNNEYRAFITDTYQVGTVSFSIRVETGTSFDTYGNSYEVAAYNLDFVDAVNEVKNILTQPPNIDVLGTYYEVGDSAKVIAQLSSSGKPINNASCYTSIYKPDNNYLVYYEYMQRISNEGVYVYDLIAPEEVGVYPITVSCDYVTQEFSHVVIGAEYNKGKNVGGGPTALWYDDEVYSVLETEELGDNEVIDVNLVYAHNSSGLPVTGNMFVRWNGYTEILGEEAHIYWYNVENDSWDISSNTLNSEFITETFDAPQQNLSIYVNNTNHTKIKINGTTSANYKKENIFYDSFEDGTLFPFVKEEYISPINTGINYFLNGTNMYLSGGDYNSYDIEDGALVSPSINVSGYINISLTYTRRTSGSESTDFWSVEGSIDNGNTWNYSFEDWTGNSGYQTKTVTLPSEFNNAENIKFRWRGQMNYGNDYLFVDDISISGYNRTRYHFYIDYIVLTHTKAVGVVSDIRGGGELNIKDRLTGIENSLSNIESNLGVGTNYKLDFVMPEFYSQFDYTHVLIYLHEALDYTNGKGDAHCTLTVTGPANETSLGSIAISEVNMTSLNNGLYFYYVPPPPTGWPHGIYTLEANCEYNGDTWSNIKGFRMDYNMEDIMKIDLPEIIWNYTDKNLTYYPPAQLETEHINLFWNSSLLPLGMKYGVSVGGTEYAGGQRGKVFLQLLDSENQPIDDSTCYTSIYYPIDEIWKYQQAMTYIDEGLYVYSFDVPYSSGVYPVTGYCTVPAMNISSKIVNDSFNSGSIAGGFGWSNNWVLDGCYYESGNVYEGLYSIECNNDRNPQRQFESNNSYTSLDYSFYWRGDSLDNVGEYVDYLFEDASGTQYLLKRITNGDDDGTFYQQTGTLYADTDGFNFSGTIKFLLNTSQNLGAGDYYNFDLLEFSLNANLSANESEYEVIRGTGEVHVSSDINYRADLLLGELTNQSFKNSFIFHYYILSYESFNKTNQEVKMPLWKPFPCDSINYVQEKFSNGTIINLTYNTTIDDFERCTVIIEHDLNFNEMYDIEIITENYWREKVYEDYGTLLLEEEMINISCENYRLANNLSVYNITYNIFNGSRDNLWISCASYLQLSKYYKESVVSFLELDKLTTNFTYNQMTGLESNWIHLVELKDTANYYANTIFNGLNLGGTYSLALISDPYPPPNPLYATYFGQISSSYLNYDEIGKVPTKVWNYTSHRNLTYYEPATVNADQVGEAVWNYTPHRNLTYYEITSVNYTLVGEAVWGENYTIDSGLLGQIVYDVWDYVARYTHGELV